MKEEEGIKLVARGFVLIKTHFAFSFQALRCLILYPLKCNITSTHGTYGIYIHLHTEV